MAIQYLAADERWSATPGVFTWRGVKAQPLMYRRRLNLHCWRGVPASHIRDGLHMVHLEPRFEARLRLLDATTLPTINRRSYAQRITRYARHLAAGKALLAACRAPLVIVQCNDPLPF